MRVVKAHLALGSLVLVACDDLDLPRGMAGGGGSPAWHVTFDPPAAESTVTGAPRMSIAGPEPVSDIWLFDGALSEYHEGRVSAGDLPGTLLTRRVELSRWESSDGSVWVAPQAFLRAGDYALAVSGVGTVSLLHVSPQVAPRFTRVWPEGDATALGTSVYCGSGVGVVADEATVLDPSGVPVEVTPGVAGVPVPDCASFSGTDPAGAAWLLPPRTIGVFEVDPAPLVFVAQEVTTPEPCASGTAVLGGCLVSDDDRITLVSRDHLLWHVWNSEGRFLEVLERGAGAVLRGFAPGSLVDLGVQTLDRAGAAADTRLTVQLQPARAHLVVNEVLANALGSEPASEWVELVNDGALTVETAGLLLGDGGEPVELPAAEIAPGEYVLVVGADFAPGAGDVAPPPGTQLLRVARVGRSGLSNSGEPITLSDAAGAVLSTFPALPASVPGRSNARREPGSLDGVAASFGAHAQPGASPGTGNSLE